MLQLSDYEVDVVVEQIRIKLLSSVRGSDTKRSRTEKKSGGKN